MKRSLHLHVAPSRFHTSLAAILLLSACGGQASEVEGATTETAVSGERSQGETPAGPSHIASVASALLSNCPSNLVGVTTSGACYCPPLSSYGSIWGTGVYTADSHLCTAAVHSGIITASTGGDVSYSILPARDLFCGSTQQGVTSSRYTTNYGSYSVGGTEILVAMGRVSHTYEAREVSTNKLMTPMAGSSCMVKPVSILFSGVLLAVGGDGAQQVIDGNWLPNYDSYKALSTTYYDCPSVCQTN